MPLGKMNSFQGGTCFSRKLVRREEIAKQKRGKEGRPRDLRSGIVNAN